jgi:hypothetical protein
MIHKTMALHTEVHSYHALRGDQINHGVPWAPFNTISLQMENREFHIVMRETPTLSMEMVSRFISNYVSTREGGAA